MPPIISMKDSTKKLLNVEEIHKTFAGGQKYVFIATCNKKKCAIKMFKYGFGEREERELNFYIENENLVGIPKILDVKNENLSPTRTQPQVGIRFLLSKQYW